MASTKSSSSESTSRAPFAPVTTLIQVPVALFEIQTLATEGRASEIIPLVRSVITTTLADPDAWQKIAKMEG